MQFLARLFGRRAPTPVPPAPKQPDRLAAGIRYDAALVPRLKEDHKKLVDLFLQIKAAVAARDPVGAQVSLREFKSAFQSHIVSENVKFYSYIMQPRVLDSNGNVMVQGLRREMNEIYRAVMAFMEKYRPGELTSANLGQFGAELDNIGTVLVKRIETEETTLYTLYVQT